ncbi:hypothetical protein QE152_g36075 [Popillia japonica]|uniref:Uncharacterized protein n=1 Tax=Popillia japonica TaxID=7064 RepID=A0AAW1IEB3_POPJA
MIKFNLVGETKTETRIPASLLRTDILVCRYPKVKTGTAGSGSPRPDTPMIDTHPPLQARHCLVASVVRPRSWWRVVSILPLAHIIRRSGLFEIIAE